MEATLITKDKNAATQFFTKPKAGPRIVRYISGVNMGLSFRGLGQVAVDLRLSIDSLDSGEFVVFMNRKQTAFKMLAPNNVLVYYRHPKEHRIDPRVIALIPTMFDGKVIHMDKALEKVITNDFTKKLR